MSNIILNDDISENSSFASNLTKISQLSKGKTVIPSKKSEPDNHNIQQLDNSSLVSNLSRLAPIPIVLNADMSDNSSLVSNLSRFTQIPKHITVIPSTSIASETKLSFQQMPISASNSTTNNTNYDTEIASNTQSKNSTHISVYSSETGEHINTPSIVINSNNLLSKKHNDITNRVVIDVAVLCQEYTAVETMCHDNIINLDEIPISKEVFQSIFYPYHDNFGLNKDFVSNNNHISSYISFIPEFRSVHSKKFYLLEEILSNIERDLNISRNCFTKETLVELTNEIISIKSLCDINCCSVLASLSWKNILEIIKNYQIINSCQCTHFNNKQETYCPICKTSKSEIIPICVVNIIFKTPTPGVKNTIIRFNYRITNL